MLTSHRLTSPTGCCNQACNQQLLSHVHQSPFCLALRVLHTCQYLGWCASAGITCSATTRMIDAPQSAAGCKRGDSLCRARNACKNSHVLRPSCALMHHVDPAYAFLRGAAAPGPSKQCKQTPPSKHTHTHTHTSAQL